MRFLGLNNFLRNYSILPRKLNKILWKSFLVNRRERFHAISETKSNTVHLKYTTLLSLQQQNQDPSLLLLQGLDCLALVNFYLLILYNELVMLSFPSFHSLFCSCKSSDLNSRSCSSFFRRKPTTSYVNLQLCFYSQCHLSLTFSCFSKSFHCFFFLFLEFCFFRFRYQTVFFEYLLRFYVHFLQISLLGLQEVVTFDFSPVFDLYLFMKVVKWSLRPRTVTANSSQMFNIGYIPYLRIYFHLYPCSPLLSS